MAERRADCVVIGKKGGEYYLTIAEAGGPVTTLAMNEAVYHAMMLRAAEQQVSDARMRVSLPIARDSGWW